MNGDDNRTELMKFFRNFRDSSLVKKSRIILDFSKTRYLLAHSMILFVAEVDRVSRILGDQFSLQIANVKDRNVKEVLVQIGFYELCNQPEPKLSRENFSSTVKHWRYATGWRVDDDTNRAFDEIEGRMTPELRQGMWKGVSEALVNSVQHAYAEARGTNGGRMKHARWWMFSQELNGELTVVVCDLGIGIPRSLPLNWKQGILSRIMEPFGSDGPDSQAIRASLEVGATSTHKGNRGKGLPQIWRAVRSADARGIEIFSNHGKLGWGSADDVEKSSEFRRSINGTVIMWTVKVSPTEDL